MPKGGFQNGHPRCGAVKLAFSQNRAGRSVDHNPVSIVMIFHAPRSAMGRRRDPYLPDRLGRLGDDEERRGQAALLQHFLRYAFQSGIQISRLSNTKRFFFGDTAFIGNAVCLTGDVVDGLAVSIGISRLGIQKILFDIRTPVQEGVDNGLVSRAEFGSLLGGAVQESPQIRLPVLPVRIGRPRDQLTPFVFFHAGSVRSLSACKIELCPMIGILRRVEIAFALFRQQRGSQLLRLYEEIGDPQACLIVKADCNLRRLPLIFAETVDFRQLAQTELTDVCNTPCSE